MAEPSRLDETAIAVGQFREFMHTTRHSLSEVRTTVEQTRADMHQHRLEARESNLQQAHDIAEIKVSMDELYKCVKAQQRSSHSKFHKKSIVLGAVGSVFLVGLLTMVAAGQDGDLLATLARIVGILL